MKKMLTRVPCLIAGNQQNRFLANSPPALSGARGNPGAGGGPTGFPSRQNNNLNNNVIDEQPRKRLPRPPRPLGSTTAIPLGVSTTTRKPPRVKSDIRAKQQQQGGSSSVPLLPPSDSPPPIGYFI